MRLAKRTLMAALVVGLAAASAERASAGFTYNVNLSVPNAAGGGNLTAIGTITVDMLGTLTTGDITAYSIAISSPNNPTAILTPVNSTFFKDFYLTLSASAANLTISYPDDNGGPENFELLTYIYQTNGIGSLLLYQFHDVNNTYLDIANQPTLASPSDEGNNDMAGVGPFVVGTAAVPEPSSAVLATIGAGTVLASGRVRRLRQRRRQAAAV